MMNVSTRLPVLFCAFCAAGVIAASVEDISQRDDAGWARPSVELSADLCSKQMTYGIVDNPDSVCTLGASIEWEGFSVGAEGIFDTSSWGADGGGYGDRKNKWQELGLSVGYAYEFAAEDWNLPTTLGIGLSYAYVTHPSVPAEFVDPEDPGDPNPDTQVLQFVLEFPDILLSPALSWECDIDDERGAQYWCLEIGHGIELVEEVLSLELGSGVGFGNGRRNEYDGVNRSASFKDLFASAALEWTALDNVTVSPYVAVVTQLDGDLRAIADESNEGDGSCIVYGGLSASMAF